VNKKEAKKTLIFRWGTDGGTSWESKFFWFFLFTKRTAYLLLNGTASQPSPNVITITMK
jgi:hypothetical protein